MPLRASRFIGAIAIAFAVARTGLAAVNDTAALEASATDITAALGARLICRFGFHHEQEPPGFDSRDADG